jgi:hypothetical protein
MSLLVPLTQKRRREGDPDRKAFDHLALVAAE